MEKLKKEGDSNMGAMSENLNEMLKEGEGSMMFSEKDLDFPAQEEVQEQTENVASEEASPVDINKVNVVQLVDWFEANYQNFANINQVKVSIRGVDPQKTLIVTVANGEKDSDGNDKRDLKVFDSADAMPVLDLVGIEMDVYNNGFKVVYPWTPDVFIKAYGVKGGMICTSCISINGSLIPYNVSGRIKKTDTTFDVPPSVDITDIQTKMSQTVDMEAVQLLYKQISKATETFTNKKDVIDWLLERQSSVTDINHHLQIDNVIIAILS